MTKEYDSQKALEVKLDNLLKITNEGLRDKTMSKNNELFFETLTLLEQYNFQKAYEYLKKYNRTSWVIQYGEIGK